MPRQRPGSRAPRPPRLAAPGPRPSPGNAPSYVLHLVGDVVEGRVAVDLAFGRLEQLAGLVRVARDDLGRGHHPQAHPLHPPRVRVARMGERELRVRSMNAANVT